MYTPQLMFSQAVDLQLMPHSASSPMPDPLFPAKAVAKFKHNLKNLPSYYAAMLGIPVVFINKCGPWVSPIPFMPFLTRRSSFPGLSAIVDSDGAVKARLGDEEGVIVEEVTPDPSRKTGVRPTCHGRWSMKMPWVMNQFRLIEAAGSAWYRHSSERKGRAREISSSIP